MTTLAEVHQHFLILSLRDVLPFTLKLPEAIVSAKTQKELEEVSQLGAGSLIDYCVTIHMGGFASFYYKSASVQHVFKEFDSF